MTEAFGDDRSVALVAMKVDGAIGDAKAYLKDKDRIPDAALGKWIVTADPSGAYYQRITGSDKLWGYAIVDAEGRVADTGYCGMKSGDKFSLANTSKKDSAGGGTPVLPADAGYLADLGPVVRFAELGKYGIALQGVRAFSKGKTKDGATKLKEDLGASLAKRVEAWSAALTGSDVVAKYDAYRGLKSVSTLTELEAAKAAKAALAKVKADKDLTKEEKAEAAYWQLIGKGNKLDVAGRRSQLPAALKQFAAAYPGTATAERALAEAEALAKAPAR